MSIQPIYPIIFSLVVNPIVAGAAGDVYLPSRATAVNKASLDDSLTITRLSAAEPSTKKLTLHGGKLNLKDLDAPIPKFSNLMALVDYALGAVDIDVFKSYDGDTRSSAKSMHQDATNVAFSELKEQGFSPENISEALSLILEPEQIDHLPQELTMNQKAFFTRVLYEAKEGRVDEELTRAIELIRNKPMTEDSLIKYNLAIGKTTPSQEALVES